MGHTVHQRFFRVLVLVSLCVPTSGPAEAQVLRQLTDFQPDARLGCAVDDDGTTVVSVWRGDPFGTNPDHVHQIFRSDLPGAALTQLTQFPEGLTRSVSITDDGEWIVFDSSADPVQQNGDGTMELFRLRSNGSEFTQITNDDLLGGGDVQCPAISGSGNRILFYGTYDPYGTNPNHLVQLFVFDLGTSQLNQLTQGDSGLHVPVTDGRCHASISDDGERIAFSSSADLTGLNPGGFHQVFKIGPDGHGLQQLTFHSAWHSYAAGISGNGEIVLYTARPTPNQPQVRVALWDGSSVYFLTEGLEPSITDDATVVYLGGYFISAGGGTLHSLSLPSGNTVSSSVVSGARTRTLFVEQLPGCREQSLGVIGLLGSGYESLGVISEESRSAGEPAITADGTRVAHLQYGNCGFSGLARLDVDTGDSSQVFAGSALFDPEVASNGESIVFWSLDDLAGTGTCSPMNVYRIQADGTGLTQMTMADNCGYSFRPALAADTDRVVFGGSLVGFGGSFGDVFSVPLAGGTPSLVAGLSDSIGWRDVVASADGLWAAWHNQDLDGVFQVYRGRTDGSSVENVTDYLGGSLHPAVSGDGRFVAFDSAGNPLGTNGDANDEIFVRDMQTGTVVQLTDTTDGRNFYPRISAEGETVYFLSDSSSFGVPPEGGFHLLRIHRQTGLLERAGSLHGAPAWGPYGDRDDSCLTVDADGGRLIFVSPTDSAGRPLGNDNLWLSDFDTPATIRPGAAAPTVVEWDADPRAVHYDVIRGSLADLSAGPGGTIDLGGVLCLENDTFNTSTAGAEVDVEQPAPGQGFFFLRRWDQGLGDGPGSYGRGSGGGERLPAGGDCTP